MLFLTVSCISLFILAIVLMLRILQIKRQIRNFTKEAEKLKDNDYNEPFETEEININTMFTEAILEQNEWIEALKIKTQFYIPDETIIINSNKHYLMRIIDNLFSNSKKYTSNFIGTELKQKNSIVTMRVYNDTDKYDAIDTKKVFEPFYHTKAQNKAGSGLGLYIVKDISDKLGFDVNAFYDVVSGINVFTVEIRMKAFI